MLLNTILPITTYILLIIILIVGIILGIRLICTLNKVDKVVDDVNDKVQTLNGFFHIIDFTTDKLVGLSDFIVDKISGIISRKFSKGKKKKEDIDNE